MIPGVDVSYVQRYPSWAAARGTGKVQFVYARATYGSNPADDDGPIFAFNHDQCKQRSIPFAPYTFWIAAQDPKTQADHFLSAIDGREGDAILMVDVEEGSGVEGWGSIQHNIEVLGQYLDIITKAICQPLIYTNADTWNTFFGGTDAFSGHKLFVASYGTTPGNPVLPNGFTDWTIHQYTSGGIVPGIPGFVDLDVLRGDLSTILRP